MELGGPRVTRVKWILEVPGSRDESVWRAAADEEACISLLGCVGLAPGHAWRVARPHAGRKRGLGEKRREYILNCALALAEKIA